MALRSNKSSPKHCVVPEVAPGEVDYLEAHGTGTSLGDPIEVQAAGTVFGEGREPDRPLLIGSVKTNIGHLEAASGIAGLIKVVLSLEHEMLPKHLHFRNPSPHIPWDRLPVRVVDEATPWQRNDRSRLAGVSSFGFSGTNAHVLVGEAPVADTAVDIPAEPARREVSGAAAIGTYTGSTGAVGLSISGLDGRESGCGAHRYLRHGRGRALALRAPGRVGGGLPNTSTTTAAGSTRGPSRTRSGSRRLQ